MLELGSSGSVRGVLSNEHPYRHPRSKGVIRASRTARENGDCRARTMTFPQTHCALLGVRHDVRFVDFHTSRRSVVASVDASFERILRFPKRPLSGPYPPADHWPLSAQLGRPRPRSGMSALRRFC